MQYAKLAGFCATGVATVMCLVSGAAMAAALDGTSNLICATTDVIACTETGGCQQGPARNFDLPEFLVLDVEQKIVRGTHFSGVKEVSPVKNMEVSGGHLIVQGVELGRGWALTVDGDTGAMKASVVGDEVSFMVYGTCTPI